MKKYFFLILSLWQSLSWASDPSQLQDLDPKFRSEVFKVLCENKLLDYLFHKRVFYVNMTTYYPPDSKNFHSFTLVSKEWNTLAYQETKAITVEFDRNSFDKYTSSYPLYLPFYLYKFQNLKGLKLRDWSKDQTSIPPLTLLTHLQALKIEKLDDIGDSTGYLTVLTNLQVFKAKDCGWFTDSSTQPFKNLTTLQTLHLEGWNGNQFTDSSLKIIGGLTRLKDLKLEILDDITSIGLNFIFQLTQLERLSLRLTIASATPPPFEKIGHLTLLQNLRIEQGEISKEHLPLILVPLINLRILNLWGCNVFEDNSLREFLKSDPLPKLTAVLWEPKALLPEPPFEEHLYYAQKDTFWYMRTFKDSVHNTKGETLAAGAVGGS